MIEVVAFDGDDTLWHSESLFAVTHERFAELLAPYVDAATLEERLLSAERRNLQLFGYGVKGFTLSMIETAIEVSDHRVQAAEIAAIVEWGKSMLGHPVELLDGVEDTLRALADDYRLALVTKGDLFHQESKIAGSGLGELFERISIVAEKDPVAYTRVTSELGVAPQRFLMVGNSVRSDVLPVVAIGGQAVHIPYRITWALEQPDQTPDESDEPGHRELSHIRELPGLLAALGDE